MVRKSWQTPELEKLDIGMTMAGTGTHYVDWSYVGGLHIETTDTDTGYPAPPIPHS